MLEVIRDSNFLVVRLFLLLEDFRYGFWDEFFFELFIVGVLFLFEKYENVGCELLRKDFDCFGEKCDLKEFLLEFLEFGIVWWLEGNWWLVDDEFNCKVFIVFFFGFVFCEYEEGIFFWIFIFERREGN